MFSYHDSYYIVFQSNENIVIIPTDKGNATVVMDRVKYSNKLTVLIGNGGCCNVKKDTILKRERKLSKFTYHKRNTESLHNTTEN